MLAASHFKKSFYSYKTNNFYRCLSNLQKDRRKEVVRM